MKTTILEKLLPRKTRLNRLRQKILDYYAPMDRSLLDPDLCEALDYLCSNPIDVFPYPFKDHYHADAEEIDIDEATNLLYIHWDGHKLFYKASTKRRKAAQYFSGLRMEQDPQSPHCYLDDDFHVLKGDVVLDIGAAEGNFGASVINDTKKLYLFEPAPEWQTPLASTFAPWKDKVTIVDKLVSDQTTGAQISLDDYIDENQPVHFMKIDVEGAELSILKGAKSLIDRQPKLKIAVCAYHRQNDEAAIRKALEDFGFRTWTTPRYMLFHYGKTNVVEPPYFRKGVIRAEKI